LYLSIYHTAQNSRNESASAFGYLEMKPRARLKADDSLRAIDRREKQSKLRLPQERDYAELQDITHAHGTQRFDLPDACSISVATFVSIRRLPD
jgi:hypothetical protein